MLHLCSGALQVPDSSMSSTVMLAGCVGAEGVCTELRPAGNKVRSIRRAGDTISELWKPSWAWVNSYSHILCSSLDRLPLTGVKATVCPPAFSFCGSLRENLSKRYSLQKSTELFVCFFFFTTKIVRSVFSDTFKSNFEEPVSEHFCWNYWSLLTGICIIRNLLHQFQRIPVTFVWLLLYTMDVIPFFFLPMVPAFSDGLLKIEGTCYSRHNNKLSSEVATEIFRINDINCQFLLGKKGR